VFSGFIEKEVSRWGVDPSKVVVMPLGMDLARMSGGDRRRIREKYGVGGDFLLLYVGRLVRFKRVDELIRVVSRSDGVRLLVVGGGPEREGLEALAGELRVADRVKFGGVVPDGELPDYYAACNAWATASRHEGFCVPIIEAMAAGKPVIVPDVAASPETAGGGGLVYDGGDPRGLTDQVARLKADGRLYGAVSGAARERALQFEMRDVLKKYLEAIVGLHGR
jgi:glycosyltransferase involved in cell wall biosynthesis